MTVLTQGQVKGILARKGFTAESPAQISQAVRVFQDAWRLPYMVGGVRHTVPLVVDEKVGPLTSAALLESDRLARAGEPDLAPHFSFAEFACPCKGSCHGCRGIVVAGSLVDGAVLLRKMYYPDGLHIISAYRCPGKNEAVDGASSSMHLFGAGMDFAPRVSTAAMRKLGAFSGIGTNRRSGKASHADTRGMARATAPVPPNVTGGTVRVPTTWFYNR